MLLLTPSYTLKRPVLGGQAAFSLTGFYGNNSTSVDATLTGPGGNQISGRESDSLTSYGDLYPQASLRWNLGVNNAMVYVTGDIPVGDYDPDRLANIGIGHSAIDAGYGYTYFDTKKGHEFSAVLGLTYNFENTDTDYKNGIDAHLDYGISQFLSESLQVGAVGYLDQQVTGDSGSGDRVGSFELRVAGIGPQIGYLFPAGKMQGHLNLKGYYEFDAANRPDGWNAWLTLSFSASHPAHVAGYRAVSEDGVARWNCSARACSASGMVRSLPLVVWSVMRDPRRIHRRATLPTTARCS